MAETVFDDQDEFGHVRIRPEEDFLNGHPLTFDPPSRQLMSKDFIRSSIKS
jgi:hypothetical protein